MTSKSHLAVSLSFDFNLGRENTVLENYTSEMFFLGFDESKHEPVVDLWKTSLLRTVKE